MYERYCKLRDSQGLTDAEIARQSGLNKSTFSDWKSGKGTPKADKLLPIAKCLGTTIEYLMTGENPFTVEMAEIDVDLLNMNKQMKEYALKMAALPKEKQEHIMSLIDMLSK